MNPVTNERGRFECQVKIEPNNDKHRTKLVEDKLFERKGITQEFIELLTWKSCKRIRDEDGMVVYKAEATIHWE